MAAEQQFEAAQTEKAIYGEGVLIQLKELNENFREAMKLATTNPQIAQAFQQLQPTMEQVLATMQPPQQGQPSPDQVQTPPQQTNQ
jgi:CHASE3 domain sensor protein